MPAFVDGLVGPLPSQERKGLLKSNNLFSHFAPFFWGEISKKNCTCVTFKKRYHELGICGWTSGAFYHLIKKKKRVDTNLQKRLSLFSLQRGVTLPAFLDRLEPLTLTIEKRVDFLLFLNFSTKILLHVVTFFFGKDTTSPAFVDRLEGPPAVSGGRPSAARHLSPSTLWLHLSTFFLLFFSPFLSPFFLSPFLSLFFSFSLSLFPVSSAPPVPFYTLATLVIFFSLFPLFLPFSFLFSLSFLFFFSLLISCQQRATCPLLHSGYTC